ncbi:threonine ammonia-lyase IlvA [Candidatus Woesearchaeota archaeon]|nr:threonine ammonia-lyase IlvA [Candidatus Woesearchaeota archaeon]
MAKTETTATTPAAITSEDVARASQVLKGVVKKTLLQRNEMLSARYKANIYLKFENEQPIRSYKLRGAYNLIAGLSEEEKRGGIVAASAGNHSQAVAYSCNALKIKATIFMPKTTPPQKVQSTERFGNGYVKVVLEGDDFDSAYASSLDYLKENGGTYVHPFNDPRIMAGQGTIAKEVLEQFPSDENIDYLLVPIGGGGLISGVGSYFKALSPKTNLIGVEPEEAPAMHDSLMEGKLVSLLEFSHFVDGAAVKQVGENAFAIAKELGYPVELVPEGRVCTSVIELYRQGIVAELAGALSVAALENLQEEIRGKNVVCILSGGNNDFDRLPEIRERSLMHEGLKHYFIIEFPQRPGALREFLDNALGPDDDIARFEYTKKTAAETGPALVGISFKRKEDYLPFVSRMKEVGFTFEHLNENGMFLKYFL